MVKMKKMLSILVIISLVIGVVGVVNVDPAFAAKKIHVKKKTVTVIAGKTYQQKLIGKNGKAIKATKVKWKSSKKSVAKINKKGKITGVKAGIAKMTAKYKGKTYKFTVKVKPKYYNNYIKLKKFIVNNGVYQDEFDCYTLGGTYNLDGDIYTYDFDYNVEMNYISMWVRTQYGSESSFEASMVADIDLSGSADPMCFFHFENGDTLDMECNVAASRITTSNELRWTVYENDSSFSGSEASVQGYCNALLDVSLIIWDDELWNMTGLTLHDLGFTRVVW